MRLCNNENLFFRSKPMELEDHTTQIRKVVINRSNLLQHLQCFLQMLKRVVRLFFPILELRCGLKGEVLYFGRYTRICAKRHNKIDIWLFLINIKVIVFYLLIGSIRMEKATRIQSCHLEAVLCYMVLN